MSAVTIYEDTWNRKPTLDDILSLTMHSHNMVMVTLSQYD